MGDVIRVGNVDGVGIAIGTGASVNIYGDIHYYPITLKAPLRELFQPLIDNRSQLFGGRAWAFERIAEFIQTPAGGYLVVTAPAGFGKTALLANLVSRTPQAFAYHFFAPLYGEESLSELFFLRNMVEQMALWHGHSEELPTRINDLRALFHHFIDEPLEHTQVMVIDGLDEVSAWSLEPYLSRPVPEHLHLIVSVRDVGQDWRKLYGFPAAQLRHLPLEGLAPAEVAEVLRAGGVAGAAFADDPQRLEAVCSIVANAGDGDLGADPFYARYLAEDIRDGRVTADNLHDQPRGLEAYLDSWWREIKKLAGDAPTRDLFGTLAAALGPIGRQDLEAVNPSLVDDWAGDFFEEVLARVRRLVMGNAESGYSLAHPRLRTYLADPARIGKIDAYRDRLLVYCAGWRDASGLYPMQHYAGHLAQAGGLERLYRLFDGEWIAAQWLRLGSYARLVTDLDLAVQAHRQSAAPDCVKSSAMAVARQTARELMLNFPAELLEVLIRLGQIDRVLAMLEALNSTRGRAAEPLSFAARALLQRQMAAPGEGRDLRVLATALLDRAVDLLPRQRSANGQMEVTAAIARAIREGSALGEASRERLVQDTLAQLEATGDPTLHAIGIGRLAAALLSHTEGRQAAAELFQRVWPILERIDFQPDRVAVTASLLPVVQGLSPGDSLPLIERLFDDPEALLQHASLFKNPLLRLIGEWNPAEEPERDRALALLERFAELPHRYPDYDYAGTLVSACCRQLLKLGLVDQVLARIERLWALDPTEGARVVMSEVEGLYRVEPKQTLAWLEACVEFTDPSYYTISINREFQAANLGYSFAAVGDWARAAELLSGVRAEERCDAVQRCLRLAGEHLADDPKGLVQRVDALLAQTGDAEPELQAKTHAVAAGVLVAADPDRSRLLAAKATALCLVELPEGDTDELRNLQAMAHHLEGDHAAAAQVAGEMAWITGTVTTLTQLIRGCGEQQQAAVERYAESLLASMRDGAGRSLFGDALIAAAGNQRELMARSPAAARALDRYLLQASVELSSKDWVRCLATLAASIAPVDAVESDTRFRKLISQLQGALENGYGVEAQMVFDVYRSAAEVAPHLDAGLLLAFAPLDAYFDQPIDALRIRCVRTELTAAFDCQAAETRLHELRVSLDGFRALPPDAFYLAKMIADFTGDRVGPRLKFVGALKDVGASVANCVRTCPEMALRELAALLELALSIDDSPNDLAQALADLCRHCGSLTPATAAGAVPILSWAVQRAMAMPSDLTEHVAAPAVQALLSLGQLDQARALVDGLPDQPWRSSLGNRIDIERERQALGELSLFDQAFARLRNTDLAYAVLHSVKVVDEARETFEFLCESIAGEELSSERGRLLSEFVPLLTAPLQAEGGAAAIAGLADAIEAFDGHFRDAARRIAQGG